MIGHLELLYNVSMTNPNIQSTNYSNLFESIYDLYHLPENKNKLLFHGWHHIKFVHDKAIEFAGELQADVELVACSALVHDLNYIFTEKLEPEEANRQIEEYLIESGYSKDKAQLIINNIENAHTEYRMDRDMSNESKALSDADTLFKALPTTPILFASKFLTQNKYDIAKLANKVVSEQKPLIEEDKYFYTEGAKDKYMEWAKTNLQLWENVLSSLEDSSVRDMLKNAYDLEVL